MMRISEQKSQEMTIAKSVIFVALVISSGSIQVSNGSSLKYDFHLSSSNDTKGQTLSQKKGFSMLRKSLLTEAVSES